MAVLQIGNLPLGYRFHPTDQELVNGYLNPKNQGLKSKEEMIAEVDVCKCEPWDLPGKSLIPTNDLEWFFFSPCNRKYPNGHRSNRATEAGYWKATGPDREIKSRSDRVKSKSRSAGLKSKSRSAGLGVIGKKKSLVFHKGRAPNGKATSWIIHEYRATKNELDGKDDGGQGSFVLCRLFNKNPDENSGNSNCDVDANNGDSNFDMVEWSDLSPPTPTTTMSSPVETQNADDAVEQFKTTLNQGIPVLDMQEKPGSIAKQPINIEVLLADKAVKGTSNPSMPEDIQSSNYVASDVEDQESEVAAIEVDTLLQDFEMFYEPTFGPIGKQLVNMEKLLADKADNGTSDPSIPEDVQDNNCMSSDVKVHEAEVVATEVDPQRQAIGMFNEPASEPLDIQDYLDADWARIFSCDSPFYGYSMVGQQIENFQHGRVHLFNNEDGHSSLEDSSWVNTINKPGVHRQRNQFVSGDQGRSQEFEFASGGADNEWQQWLL
ncbi:uncharacterized protein LOC143875989 [Tasmannia lanceolata]|uniref:uncharacterized protein LOC143875989 n=1 Tax=Tasmannia lanceolata TaxID=3420 RepID=UPI0040630810